MEIDPLHQKTLPDFLLTEKMLGVKTVDIVDIKKEGSRLYYERSGKRIPIQRIYNRAIVDELERKSVKLGFDWRDDLDVEWAGHPNWYFRISKFSIPYLKHASVPKTWFLDRLEEIPDGSGKLCAEAAVFVRRAGRRDCADERRYCGDSGRTSVLTTFCRSGCTLSR